MNPVTNKMMTDTLNKYLLISLLVILCGTFLFVPSAYNRELFDPTQTTKSIMFLGAMLIAFLLVYFYGLLNKSYAVLSFLDISLLIIVSYIVITRYFLNSVPGFSLRFWELLGLLILYTSIRILPPKMYLFLVLSIVTGGIIQMLSGVSQLVGFANSNNPKFPVTGNFFNPGGYAGYISLILIISYWLYKNRKAQSWSGLFNHTRFNTLVESVSYIISIIGIIGAIILLPTLRSRSSLISSLAGLTIIWIMQNRETAIKYFQKFKRFTYAAFILLALLVFSIYIVKKESADGRILIYKVSLNILLKNPIWGIGFDKFKTRYMPEQAAWFENQKRFESPESQLADDTMYAFNEPLQFTLENGLIGILLIILIITTNYTIGVTGNQNRFLSLSNGIVIAIISFGMLTYMSDNLSMKIIGTLGVAILGACKSRKLVLFSSRNIFKSLAFRLFMASVILSVFLIGADTTVKFHRFLSKWRQAQDMYQQELYSRSNEIFRLIASGSSNGELLMQYGKSLYMSNEYSAALLVLQQSKNYFNSSVIETTIGDCERKLGNYQKAEEAYVKAMYMTPAKFYPFYLLLVLYNEQGKKERANEIARKILKKEIKIPSKAISEIKEMARVTLNSNN